MRKEIISLVVAMVSNYIARGQERGKTYASLYATSYLLNVFNVFGFGTNVKFGFGTNVKSCKISLVSNFLSTKFILSAQGEN